VCGPLVFGSIVDTNDILTNDVSNLIKVLGIDSTSNFEFKVYSADCDIIDKDKSAAEFTFSFNNVKAKLDVTYIIRIDLQYPSYITLLTLSDITHSVIDPTTVSTRELKYDKEDCYGTCGEVNVFIYLPEDAPKSLADVVILEGNNVKVTSAADYNVFGTYNI